MKWLISVRTVERPYLITFTYAQKPREYGGTYPLTSAEAQKLLDEYPILSASPRRVIIRGEGSTRCVLKPATLGGGVAFVVSK